MQIRGKFLKNLRRRSDLHLPAQQILLRGTIDQSQPYKISLTDDPFASSKVSGEVLNALEMSRNLLKTYILITVTRNSGNWHSSCTSEEWD